MRRIGKRCVDAAMYLLLLYLMSYRAGRGLLLHGILGCALFALFVLHNLLNLRWYRGLRIGKYTGLRMLFVIADILLLADCVLMAVSSVQMSGDIFAFSPFLTTQSARSLHRCTTAWGYMLTAFHLGLHTAPLFGRLHKTVKETFFAYAYNLLFGVVLVFGIFCFAGSGLWRNMLLLPKGNTAFSELHFYAEYVMIMVAVCQAVYLLLTFLGKMADRKKQSIKGE